MLFQAKVFLPLIVIFITKAICSFLLVYYDEQENKSISALVLDKAKIMPFYSRTRTDIKLNAKTCYSDSLKVSYQNSKTTPISSSLYNSRKKHPSITSFRAKDSCDICMCKLLNILMIWVVFILGFMLTTYLISPESFEDLINKFKEYYSNGFEIKLLKDNA